MLKDVKLTILNWTRSIESIDQGRHRDNIFQKNARHIYAHAAFVPTTGIPESIDIFDGFWTLMDFFSFL